jgi:dTDP-4-dehydrorhamnose reductase
MMNPQVLLLGGSGYVGSAFRLALEAAAVPYRNLSRADADYTRDGVLDGVLRSARPDFLINCAGYTGRPNVDACELHKADCLQGNSVLPGVIRRACESAGVPWAHVSSGCIYSGVRPDGGGFTEEDAPNFSFRSNHCSFYSGTKALGEEVLAGAESCYVWRIRIPFNEQDGERNYLSKIMRYSRLLDVRNSLTQLDEFARAALQCWRQGAPFGVYNMTNPGSITTREVTELIRRHGLAKREFSFFRDEAEFMAVAAKTPRSSCVLDASKSQRAGLKMSAVHEAIDKALRNWRWA